MSVCISQLVGATVSWQNNGLSEQRCSTLKTSHAEAVKHQDDFVTQLQPRQETLTKEKQQCQERIARMQSDSEKTLEMREEEKKCLTQELHHKDKETGGFKKKPSRYP